MTREEAKEAIKSNRINHHTDEAEGTNWITQCTNGNIYYDDGGYINAETFWKLREHPVWDDRTIV